MEDLDTSDESVRDPDRRAFIATGVGATLGVTGAMIFAEEVAEAATQSSANLLLYHLDGTRSERVIWLMEELGLPYVLSAKPGMAGMADIKAAHPMGMSPTVVDGKLTLVESGAILEYIIHRYGAGRLAEAPSSPGYASYLLWLHYAEGSAAPRIINDYVSRSIPDVATLSPIAGRQIGGAGRVLNFVNMRLGETPHFAGENFTAADIIMHFPLKLTRMWGVDFSLYPNVAAWFDRVEGRPAFAAAMAKGSPNGTAPPPGRFQPLLAPTGKETAPHG